MNTQSNVVASDLLINGMDFDAFTEAFAAKQLVVETGKEWRLRTCKEFIESLTFGQLRYLELLGANVSNRITGELDEDYKNRLIRYLEIAVH